MIAGTILGAMARPYVAMGIGAALLASLAFGGVQTYRLGKEQASRVIAEQNVTILKGGAMIAVQRNKAEKYRIEAAQTKETARAEALKSNLDLIGGKYDRLLSSRTNRGSAGKADLRRNVGCPGLDVDQGTCNGLLAYRDRSGRLAERCERDAFQLNALIDLYNAQQAINREPSDGR